MSNRWSCVTNNGFGYLASSRVHGGSNKYLSMARHGEYPKIHCTNSTPTFPQPTPQSDWHLGKMNFNTGNGKNDVLGFKILLWWCINQCLGFLREAINVLLFILNVNAK